MVEKQELAQQIIADQDFEDIQEVIEKIFENGSLSAGGPYGDVWIRDTNIFWEAYLETGNDPQGRQQKLRQAIIDFLKGQEEKHYQAADKSPDQYGPDVEVVNSIADRFKYNEREYTESI